MSEVEFNIKEKKNKVEKVEEKVEEKVTKTKLKAVVKLKEQYEEDVYIGEIELGEDVLSIVQRGDKLIAGSMGNAGINSDYTFDYDDVFSLDENIQSFVEEIEADVNQTEIPTEDYVERFEESRKRMKLKFAKELKEAKSSERAEILSVVKDDLVEFNEMVESYVQKAVSEAIGKEKEITVEKLKEQKMTIFKLVREDLEELDSELVKTLTEDLEELDNGIEEYISDDRVITNDEDEEIILDDEGNVISKVKEDDEKIKEGEDFDDLINQKNIDVDDVRDALTDLENDVESLKTEDFEPEDFLTDLGMEDMDFEDLDFGEDFGEFDLEDSERDFLIESIKQGKVKSKEQLKNIVESFRDNRMMNDTQYRMKKVFENKEKAILKQAEQKKKKPITENKQGEEKVEKLTEHQLFKKHFIDRNYL